MLVSFIVCYVDTIRILLDKTVYREEMRFALRSSYIIKLEIKQLGFLEIFILYTSENSIHTERQKGYYAAPPSHWHTGGGWWLWLFDWLYSSCTRLPISLSEESIWCCFCTCPKWKKEILSVKSARPQCSEEPSSSLQNIPGWPFGVEGFALNQEHWNRYWFQSGVLVKE